MSEGANTLEALLRRASDLPAAERLQLLRAMYRTDSHLYSLAANEHGGEFRGWWDEAADSSQKAPLYDEPAPASTGAHIGRYRVIGELGRGGMGEVVLAERDDAEFQQRVAIKHVRRGLVSKQVRSRLRAERQILAQLNHPNIAKLLDGGAGPDGAPFIVMEYVEGRPIDVYCDEERLTLDERIELFRTVCAAVHYAHQNLIVHRDLKPSNILVSQDRQPKLLDFGIAKLLDERQTMHTLAVTHADYRMLTPDHASPEQLRGEAITTASDTYVLGIVLYELLTGDRPFNVTAASLGELELAICEQLPTPPSVFIENLERVDRQAAERIADLRRTTLGKLKRTLRGDLDNIILTALRKEPERRYSSVEQLSGDLGRYLAGAPVLARPDTWSYRTAKFVRRHTLAVLLTSALLLSLAAFAATSYVQADRLARQRDLVTAQREVAEQQRQRAEQVSSFLIDLFRVSDPSESRANEVTAQEILDQGSRKIERELVNQPELRAALYETIGRVYLSLGQISKAEASLAQSLALRRSASNTDDNAVASSLSGLAQVLIEKGELEQAQALQQQAHALYLRADGESADVAKSLALLGRLFKARGDFTQAESVLEESIELYRRSAPSDPAVAEVVSDLALIALDRGALDRAEALFVEALGVSGRILGQDSLQFATQLHNLALARQAQGKFGEAEKDFLRSLESFNRIYGERHIETTRARGNYALFLKQTERLDESEREYRRVLAMDRELRGESHSLVAYDMANLASVLILRKQPAEAERLLRHALRIYENALPADHPHAGAARFMLGLILVESNRAQESVPLLERAAEVMGRAVPGSTTEAAVKSALGHALAQTGKPEEAERLLASSYETLRTQAPGSGNTERAARWLGALRQAQSKPQ